MKGKDTGSRCRNTSVSSWRENGIGIPNVFALHALSARVAKPNA
jgi:hypothetical protein